jgi:polyisoprenoid-binding protein YceI
MAKKGHIMTLRSLVGSTTIVLGSWLFVPAPAGAADTYKADPAHSSIIYRVKHMNTSYSWGRFNVLAGSFSLDEQDPSQSKFEFQVKTASIDSGNAQRDGHLKSPDFFNATQFPTITFKSTSVSKTGNDSYDVNGDLTLHGVTKPVTFKLTKTGAGRGPMGGTIAGVEANTALKRSDFKMSSMLNAVGDDVTVYVSVEGGKR